MTVMGSGVIRGLQGIVDEDRRGLDFGARDLEEADEAPKQGDVDDNDPYRFGESAPKVTKRLGNQPRPMRIWTPPPPGLGERDVLLLRTPVKSLSPAASHGR
jgi:hypothetical protein